MRKHVARWLPEVSRGTMAALLLAAPVAAPVAHASGGFAGTAAVVHGTATIATSGNVQTITLPTSSAVTTINWTPTDTATGGGAINFLPAGQTVNYVGTTDTGLTYNVLNRIIANDQTRTVAFNGAVTSTANTHLWFYSPGGLLIGSTATFNVGGLVLTTADPVVDADNNFISNSAGADHFSFAGVAGSTSAITIQSGAVISAIHSGQSNYIVAFAPKIDQGGKIAVAGSVALVAAESASFAVDSQGLFNITVSAGTTVANDTFVHTGSTGGSNTDPSGSYQRVYMVVVPKNNAIAMAIASSGSIGFSVADAANVDGNAIVLSAGGNIADTGTGNPVVAGRAGSGTASLTVGGANYTSNTYAVSTDSATVTDPALDFRFSSNLTVIAPQATVNAQTGMVAVGGDLTVDADDTLTGVGGTATLQANGGSIRVDGNALVSAIGAWSGTQNDGNIRTQGGTAQVAVNGGGLNVGGSLTVSANGDATGSYAALIEQGYNSGANATGGAAAVTVSGASATLSAAAGITVNANAISGIDGYGEGGEAAGGTALIEAESGGTIGVGTNGGIHAAATATAANLSSQAEGGYGGASFAGTAQVIANAGTITVAGVDGITADANAIGGIAPAYSGSGGSATGGTALIAVQGVSGRIATNTSGSAVATDFATDVSAVAVGADGSGYDASGGDATGGTATLQVTGANQSISFDHGQHVIVDAHADAGNGVGTGAGSAYGGSALLLANGGSIAITNTGLTVQANATGGYDYASNGGDATGGTVQLAASGGGTLNAAVATTLSAAALGGYGSGTGGTAVGGNILIDLGDNAFNFGSAASVSLDASSTAGAGNTSGTAGSAGGVRITDLGTATLAGAITLTGNTPFYLQAGGSIAVTGSVVDSDSGAYAHLWADDLGTGTGTVTLASGALNLPGAQIDIYYNPSSLGTPTDFSAGVQAGTATAYQLVDNVDQLQLVGSYPSQNFALGRNIDASATQGWNDRQGFTPIGTYGAGFTGNFDGLNHTITNLYINYPTTYFQGSYGEGLFGQVGNGTGANITIRNVGLIDPNVTGYYNVGALVGDGGATVQAGNSGPDNLVVSNSYSTGGVVSGIGSVGGLLGGIYSGPDGALTNVHSDTVVSLTGTGSGRAGGLVGSSNTDITNAFATGTVTAAAGAFSIGGLIGEQDGGVVNEAYASGAVVAPGGQQIGGLIGTLAGGSAPVVTQAYAVGSVTADGSSEAVGGLVGFVESGSISESYASGAVSAVNGTDIGGLVGLNQIGAIANSYWDTYSTGQTAGVGTNSGTVTALNPVTSDPSQSGSDTYAFGSYAYRNFSGNWTYDNDNTRPVGAWETPVAQFGVATIDSAHQVQLVDLDLGGSYVVTQNIDMRGTQGTSDIWGPGGFMPLGIHYVDPPFTGTLDGGGHVLSNLTITPSGGFYDVGLVQENYGTISNIGLANFNITANDASFIGAIAGYNAGQITDSFATGSITLTGSAALYGVAGGLAGQNYDGALEDGYFYGNRGTITQSYATVAVSGGAATGGLVGDNEGGISGSYANGLVSGTQTGGLVGESTDAAGPTITSSYWDTQLTGQSVACGSGVCGGATGLTTAQTLQSASFAGFSIDTQGGQGLPWRQYEGDTTPLLEAFLTPITVQPGSLTMQYDAETPDVGVTTYGAQPSLIFGIAGINGVTKNAGVAYAYYGGGLYSNQLGYDLVPSGTPGTVTITPAPLTLSATSDSRVYNGTTVSNTGDGVYVSGLYGDDSVGNASQSFASPNVMGANGSTLVVNNGYVINDGNGGNNYTVTLQSAPGTITPAALTLMAVTDSRSYNATTSSAGVPQASGLFGEDNVTGASQSFTSANVFGANASTLVVNPGYVVNDGNGGANYTVTLQSAQGTITPAALTLAAVSDSKVYDATTNSAGQVQPSGLFGEDNVTGLTQSFTSKNVMGANGSTLVVNSGYVVNDGNGGANYTVTLQNAQGTITPAPLTLGATPETRVYNATTASFGDGVSETGIVGNDSVGNLSQSYVSPNVMGTNGSTIVVNPGYVINDGNGGNNYAVTLQSAQGTITPATLTLAAAPDTRVYNATTGSTGVVQALGLFGQDNVTSASQSFTSPNVLGANGSTLVVNPGYVVNDGNGGNNYSVVLQNAQGTITPAALAITYTANPATSTYGNTPSGLSGTVSQQGLQGNDTLAAVTTGTAVFTTTATAQSNVGSYAITGSGLAANSNNYTYSFVQAAGNATALTIVPADLTVDVIANAQSRSYGTANPALTYTETGLMNGDMLTGSLATAATAASDVGVYAITQGSLTAGSNYILNYTGANLTVTPANLTVTYTAGRLASIYGTTPGSLSGNVNATGLVLGQTLASVTSGSALFTTLAGATSNVGTYGITGAGLAGNSSNYNFSFVQAAGNATALTIGQRALTLTANPVSRVYGSGIPITDTATAAAATATTGLVNGDRVSSEVVTSPATSSSGVGSYALNGSAAQFGAGAASNYAITYASDPTGLSITPATATITYVANPLNSIYGNTPSGLTGSEIASGLVNGDTLGSVTSGTAGFTTTATGLSNVGSFSITGSGLAGNSRNYDFSFVQAAGNATALTIVQRALTLTADPLSRVYGSANPITDTATAAATTATTGLVNGDSVSGEAVASPATSGSGVGSYALNGSAAQFGSGSGSNYAITYAASPAGLSITPAAATITYVANPLSSIYGNTPSGLTGSESASGLVNGDTLSGVTSGTAGFTTTATGLSSVGSYGITGSGLAGNSGNYSFNFVQAAGNASALTIVQRALTLTADPVSRVYGSANPITDTASVAATTATTGLVNGDNVTSETVTTPATSGSGVGSYALNGSAAQFESGLASNYAITYAPNPTGLSITPAAATITYLASPLSSIYGNVPTGLTGSETASGLVNGDTLGSVTSGAASFATTATGLSPVGSYGITGSGLAGNSGNYSFSFVQAAGNASALTIVQRVLTLTANPVSRIYGSANPVTDTATAAATTATTGLVNGDSVSSEAVTSPATSGSGVGSYALNGSAAQFGAGLGSNYAITYAANPTGLSITPAAATITYVANPLSSIYGNVPTGLTGSETASGLVNGDTLGGVTQGTASFATTATAHSNVGSYAVTGSGLAGNTGNYSFNFVQAPGNAAALSIVARALTLTADPLARVYGGANPITDTATAAATTATTGLVNGDSVSSEAVTSPATSGSGVGNYALIGSAAQFGSGLASNYAITYAVNPLGLSITPAALTLTYTASPDGSTYGQTPAGLTGTTALTGLVNDDSAASVTSGAASWTSPATATSNVGTYAITGAGIGLASGNYTLTSIQAPGNATALTVNPATLSITYTANPATRTYGGENPALSGTETAIGLVNDDTLGSVTSGAATYTTTAGTTANVGSYAITGAGLTGSSANYTYNFAQSPGNATALAVTPAAVTITYTANPLTSIYGNAPGGLSGTESAAGLVNGDTLGSVTSGAASYATTASSTSNVGAYAVVGSGLGQASGNYSFSFVQAPGNATALTIAPRPITVTADPQQRAVGAPNPPFTYVVTGPATATGGAAPGLVNGDTLTGQLASTATITSPAGSYDIVQGTLAASQNYQLTYVGNILTLSFAFTPIQAVTALIEANLPDQPGIGTPEQRRKQAAADLAALYIGLGLHPPQISQSMINDRPVTTPPPVNEPVTSNGNSSLWSPTAP